MDDNGIYSVKEILSELRDEVKTTHSTLIMHMGREESQLENILLENKKTNGRVTQLEESYHSLAVKHEAIGAKIAAITGLVSIVVAGIVSYILDNILR